MVTESNPASVAIFFNQKCKSWCAAMELTYRLKSQNNIHLIDGTGIGAPYFVSYKRRSHQKHLLEEFSQRKPKRFRLTSKLNLSHMVYGVYHFYKFKRNREFPVFKWKSLDISRIIHCKIAAIVGTRFFNSDQVKLSTFLRYSSLTMKSICFAQRTLSREIDTVYVYNGRDIFEASVALVAKSLDCKVIFCERGSSGNKLQLFQISPHYHPNWWQLIHEFSKTPIDATKLLNIEKFKVAKLEGVDTYKDELWNQGYSDADLVGIGNYTLFLTSSTIEFSPFEEYNYESGFSKNLFDALYFLARLLRNNNEKLIIRRHPNSIGRDGVDREEVIWKSIQKEPNVLYISPHENISSYQLIKGASRVYVWKSSIGFESLLLGKPTFCLASAKWAWDKSFQVHTFAEIRDSISISQSKELVTETISKYANFMANSGFESALFKSFSEQRALTNDNHDIPNLFFQDIRSFIFDKRGKKRRLRK
jgi:hypothetical protein